LRIACSDTRALLARPCLPDRPDHEGDPHASTGVSRSTLLGFSGSLREPNPTVNLTGVPFPNSRLGFSGLRNGRSANMSTHPHEFRTSCPAWGLRAQAKRSRGSAPFNTGADPCSRNAGPGPFPPETLFTPPMHRWKPNARPDAIANRCNRRPEIGLSQYLRGLITWRTLAGRLLGVPRNQLQIRFNPSNVAFHHGPSISSPHLESAAGIKKSDLYYVTFRTFLPPSRNPIGSLGCPTGDDDLTQTLPESGWPASPGWNFHRN